jgi:dipeptidyl aminopeptidase/acylaminoacyl peptidase
MRNIGILALAVAILHAGGVVVAAGTDGSIVATEPCEAVDSSYDDYVSYLHREYNDDVKSAKELGVALPPFEALRANYVTREEYQQRLAAARDECVRLRYLSDGLSVVGYVYKPRGAERADHRWPAIIYNRGGNGDFGTIGTIDLLQLQPFLDAGFVVLAPQYRGSDGGEGKDEYGGADVHDVLNIVPVALALGYIDTDSLFMYGISRGGMESFLAIKQHMPVNAAAVMGASSDEVAEDQRRPLRDVYEKLVPHFSDDPQARFRERSAIDWAEALDVPLLLMHGGSDWRVSPSNSIRLALRLEELHKPFSLFVYDGDDHQLTLHRQERDRQIIEWFRAHMKPGIKR